jgi:hypothetical protein
MDRKPDETIHPTAKTLGLLAKHFCKQVDKEQQQGQS